ncbi:hypothetical protein V8E36_000461 [Tilletia maclaganii]
MSTSNRAGRHRRTGSESKPTAGRILGGAMTTALESPSPAIRGLRSASHSSTALSSHQGHVRPHARRKPARQRLRLTLFNTFLCALLLFFTTSVTPVQAGLNSLLGPDQLFTASVAYCSPPQIVLVSNLGLRFFRENRSLEFDIAAASINNNVSAHASVNVNAFGLGIFNVALDLCTIGNGILCPLPTYNFNGGGVFFIPEQFASKIPNIAFKIPDLEALATVQLVDQTGRVVACLQTTLSNGHTTYQKGAIWGTVGLALLAAGSSFLHSAIPASLGAAQWRIVDVMAAIQHVAVVSLLSLNYPVAFSSYAANFAWSIGMINIAPIQASITSSRSKTGGYDQGVFGNALMADAARSNDPLTRRGLSSAWSPSSFSLADRGSFSPSSLLKRIGRDDPIALLRDVMFNERTALTPLNASFLNALPSQHLLTKRIYAPNTGPNGQLIEASKGGPLPLILPNTTQEVGIDLFAERLDIAPGNVFLTVLVNFAILFGLLLVALVFIYILARFFSKTLSSPNWAESFVKRSYFGDSYVTAFIGRYLLITFPILLIFACYQWLWGDSWMPKMVAGVTIFLFGLALAVFFVPMMWFADRDGPASLYYPDDLPPASAGRVPKVWGSFAHPWKPRFYLAYAGFLLWSVFRAAWIGFAHTHGFIQAIGLLSFEIALFVILCCYRPSRNGAGNAVTILLCLSRVISWAICIAFTPQASVKTIPRVIVGYVLLVATGVPIILLVFLTIVDLFSPFRPSKLRTIKRFNRIQAKEDAEKERAAMSERRASTVRHSTASS